MKWIVSLAIIIMFSCSSTKNIEELTESDIMIQLEKEGCFGKCPIYVFTMYNGGYCEFEGMDNTYKLGKHGLQLSKDKYKELKSIFKDANIFQYEDYAVGKTRGCDH